MRPGFLILMTIFQFYLCHCQTGEPFQSVDSTYIKGAIKNYNGSEEFVSYYLTDFSGETKKHLSRIDATGNFRFTFFQESERDFAIRYGVNRTAIYSKPGDTITIIIDQDYANKLYQFEKTFTIITKDNFSNEINIFFDEFLPVYSNRGETLRNITTDNSRIKKIQDLLLEDIELLDDVSKRRLLSDDFKLWAKNWLTYNAAYLISGLPFGRFDEPINIKRYVKMFDSIPLNSTSALNCSEYLTFLKWLSNAYFLISTNGKVNSSSSFKPMEDAKEYADDNHTGIVRDLVYLGLQKIFEENNKKHGGFQKANLSEKITHVEVRKYLENHSQFKSNEPLALTSLIKAHSASDSTKNKILNKLNPFKGRYIFIDFWGSWCMPCLLEMPKYDGVIKKLRHLPVLFMFLSVETSEDDMNTVKEKYNINAEFYNLDKNESHLLNDVFNFTSYPSHFLITPDQKIIKLTRLSMETLVDEIKRIVE